LQANNGSGSSNYSTILHLYAEDVPDTPEWLLGNQSIYDNFIELNWTVEADVTQYNLYRNGEWLYSGIDANYTCVLPSIGSFIFLVNAQNASGSSPNSTLLQIQYVVVPPPPVWITANQTVIEEQFLLEWNPLALISNYSLYMDGELVYQGPVASVLHDFPTLGTFYFILTASNSSGTSDNSSILEIVVERAPEPPNWMILNQTLLIGENINLEWTTTEGATSYLLMLESTIVYGGGDLSFLYAFDSVGTFDFSIQGSNSSGLSGYLTTLRITVEKIPDPPTWITPTQTIADKILLQWVPVPGVTTYLLYEGGELIYSGALANYLHVFTRLGSHEYVIQASNSTGTSDNSSLLWIIAEMSPAVPEWITENQMSLNFTLDFEWHSSEWATNYTLFVDAVPTYTGVDTNFTFTFPALGSYEIRLWATNSSGNSSFSVPITILIQELPLSPTWITLNQSATDSLFLEWNPVAGATGYTLSWDATVLYAGSATNYTYYFGHIGLHHFTLYASNSTGNSPFSEVLEILVELSPPSPEWVTINQTLTTMDFALEWLPISFVSNYSLYLNGEFLYVGNLTAYNVTFPALGIYNFTLMASNSSGNSSLSSILSLSVERLPEPPTWITVNNTLTESVFLEWNPVSDCNSYQVELNGDMIYFGSYLNYTYSFMGTGLHFFTIYAINSTGMSLASEILQIIVEMRPEPPIWITEDQIISPGLELLKWNEVNGADNYTLWLFGIQLYNITGLNHSFSFNSPGEFNFTLTATNSTGASDHSQVLTIWVANLPPAPLWITQNHTLTNQTAYLEWESVIGALNYSLWYDDTLLYLGGDTSFVVEFGGVGGYIFLLQASNQSGISAYSYPLVLYKEDTPEAPLWVTLNQTHSNDTMLLEWESVSGAAFYTLFQNGSQIDSIILVNYTFTFTQSGFYQLTLLASNSSGDSPLSSILEIQILYIPEIPEWRTNNQTTPWREIFLEWDPADRTEEYQLFVDDSLFQVFSATTINFTFTFSTVGVYVFNLKAVNSFGESGLSANLVIIVQDYPEPPLWITMNQTITYNNLTLSWFPVVFVDDYYLYMNGTFTLNLTGTEIWIDQLSNGIYHFTLRSMNTTGSSAISAVLEIIVDIPSDSSGDDGFDDLGILDNPWIFAAGGGGVTVIIAVWGIIYAKSKKTDAEVVMDF
ncbi:MAG: hypothetical protein ACTSYI_02265, partial [Promethearchaeota archaeon]